MVSIEIIRGVFYGGDILAVGTVLEVEERVAQTFIATGKAKRVNATPQEPKRRGRPRKVMTMESLEGDGAGEDVGE